MNSNIYGKLAVTNLKNNGKSYLPYVLASAFSVMMYFIMDNLYRNRSLVEKGSPLAIMLSYAAAVLLIFSVIFLFYINSFLIKRRKKELGIYNILGMEKGHLAKMIFIESDMFKKIDENDKDQLVNRHLKIVIRESLQYVKLGFSFLDLVQEATIGVINGIEKLKHSESDVEFWLKNFAIKYILEYQQKILKEQMLDMTKKLAELKVKRKQT